VSGLGTGNVIEIYMLRVFLELASADTLCTVNVTVQYLRTRHFALLGDVRNSLGEEETDYGAENWRLFRCPVLRRGRFIW